MPRTSPLLLRPPLPPQNSPFALATEEIMAPAAVVIAVTLWTQPSNPLPPWMPKPHLMVVVLMAALQAAPDTVEAAGVSSEVAPLPEAHVAAPFLKVAPFLKAAPGALEAAGQSTVAVPLLEAPGAAPFLEAVPTCWSGACRQEAVAGCWRRCTQQ